jgi:hypothetical protein
MERLISTDIYLVNKYGFTVDLGRMHVTKFASIGVTEISRESSERSACRRGTRDSYFMLKTIPHYQLC